MRWIICWFATAVSAASYGQSALENWDNLKALHHGQNVQVVETNMKSWTGKFTTLVDDAISLKLGRDGDKTIPRASVYRVTTTTRARNSLIGLAAGAGLGVGLSAWASNRIDKGYGGAMSKGATSALLMIACAGSGTAIGAAIPAHKTIYRALPEATPKATK